MHRAQVASTSSRCANNGVEGWPKEAQPSKLLAEHWRPASSQGRFKCTNKAVARANHIQSKTSVKAFRYKIIKKLVEPFYYWGVSGSPRRSSAWSPRHRLLFFRFFLVEPIGRWR